MLRVEILHFDGCPNVNATADRIRAVAAGLGIEVDLQLIRVESHEDAVRERFPGSPTVRVNGVDIDPAARVRSDFGIGCRVYAGAGVPPDAMIATALTGSSSRSGRGSAFASVGAVVAGALSSACCWLPLILVAAGLSVGGISLAFAPLRPWLIGIAVVSLAIGVWSNERRPRTSDACCTPVPRRRRILNRVMLALSALGVAAFTLFPQYVDAVFGERAARSSRAPREITLHVDGMTCAGCETGIEAALRRLPGVALADASYQDGAVVIGLAPDATIGTDAVIQAVARAGYVALPIETTPQREPIAAPRTSLRVLNSDLGPLVEHFNAAADRKRFLAILSPT